MYGRIESSCLALLLLCCWCARDCTGGELTFELPDNEKQCFYEEVGKDVKATLEFQVVTGGHYDVDCEVYDPGEEDRDMMLCLSLYTHTDGPFDDFVMTPTGSKSAVILLDFPT